MNEKLRIWINNQPVRDIYLDKNKARRYLRYCLLCGNRYPFTARYFLSSENAPDVRGFANNGVVQVCLLCWKHWDDGEDNDQFEADVFRVKRNAENLQARNSHASVKPLAHRK